MEIIITLILLAAFLTGRRLARRCNERDPLLMQDQEEWRGK